MPSDTCIIITMITATRLQNTVNRFVYQADTLRLLGKDQSATITWFWGLVALCYNTKQSKRHSRLKRPSIYRRWKSVQWLGRTTWNNSINIFQFIQPHSWLAATCPTSPSCYPSVQVSGLEIHEWWWTKNNDTSLPSFIVIHNIECKHAQYITSNHTESSG